MLKKLLFALVAFCALAAPVLADDLLPQLRRDGSGVLYFPTAPRVNLAPSATTDTTQAKNIALLPRINALSLLSPTQLADVLAGTLAQDLSATINAALNNCAGSNRVLTIEFTGPAKYGVANEIVASTCPVNIIIDRGASIVQTAGFPVGALGGDSLPTNRQRGVVRFAAGAAGSSITGGGSIDGNRAALVSSYLALPQAPQDNGLYVMSVEWDCVEFNAANDIIVDGVELKNCMSFGIGHNSGDRARLTNLHIHDSTGFISSLVSDGTEIGNLTIRNIGSVVGGTAIPWFAYAGGVADQTNFKAYNWSLSGYQVLTRDGTSGTPGNRIGDPIGGYFSFQRVTNGTIIGLNAQGVNFNDGRSTRAIWGISCDNCKGVAFAGANIKGAYWGLQLSGGWGTFTGGIFDGQYNVAAVGGQQGSIGLWVQSFGQVRGNVGLTSAFDHISNTPIEGWSIANATFKRFSAGQLMTTSNVSLNNLRFVANMNAGQVFWSQTNADYPAAIGHAAKKITMSNIVSSYNGGAGAQYNDGVNITCTGCVANNNGQESATTFVSSGVQMTPGFGGPKSNIRYTNWTALDDQSFTLAKTFSFVPGSTTLVDGAYQFQMIASNTERLNIGQHVLCKNCGGPSTDINVKIVDINDDFVTVTTVGATNFVGGNCGVSVAGTVSIANGANILTGSGTSFTTTINGPSYMLVAGQYLKIGQVLSDTSLQMDTAPTTNISGAVYAINECDAAGIPSQSIGFYAPQDANIANISIGDPSNYLATGNTNVDVSVATQSLKDDYRAYTPTMSFTGGTGVSASSAGGEFKQNGKELCFRAYATINYTTVPAQVIFTLPSGLLASGFYSFLAANDTTFAALGAVAGGGNAITVAPLSGNLASASGQSVHVNGCLKIQ